MTKIILDDVGSGYNLSKINENFQSIEDELNDKVMYRDNPVGEDNAWETNQEANSKRLLNLPDAVTAGEPITLRQFDAGSGGGASPDPFTATIESYGGVGDDSTDNTAAFALAAVDILAGDITMLKLAPNRIYHVTIASGNTLYVNYIEGNGATIVVNGEGELTYIDGVNTDLIVQDVDFVKVGDKLTPADLLSDGSSVYRATDNTTTMEVVKLNRLSFTALTDYGDKDSWEDPADIDQSRAARVIRFTGEDIDVSEIKIRGFARGITITPKVAGIGLLGTAKHKIIDVEGQNCELLVYLTIFDQDRNGNASDFTETFATGECRNIRINNTTAQSEWWVQKDNASPKLISGLDSLLIEAHHNNQLICDNIGGRGIIERPLYNQSGNAIIQNSNDRISAGGGHQIKIDLAAYPEKYRSHNIMQDCSHRGTADSASDWSFYSQADCLLKGLYSTRTNGNTGRFCLSINRKNKDCRFIDSTMEFARVGLYVNVPQFDTTAFAIPGEASQENWIFQDLKFHNVYSTDAVLGSVFGTVTNPNGFPITTFKNTLFKNIEHSFTHEGILNDGGLTSRYSFDLTKMETVKIQDCNTIFRFTPWRNRESTDIEVLDSTFTQHSDLAAIIAFNKLKPIQTIDVPYTAPLFTPPSTSTITTDSADGSSQDVIDSTADFVSDGVAAGWIAVNQTTGARGEVLSVTDLNTLRLTSGGLFYGGDADGNNNDFVIGDVYYVYAPLNVSGASGSGVYRTPVTLTDTSSETEFQSTVETGTVTTPDVTGVVLKDSAGNFLSTVVSGDAVNNTTDGSDGIVLSVDSDIQLTLSGALENGSDNQWDSSDAYTIIHNNVQIGDIVKNITDSSYGRVSSITDADNLVMALGLQDGTDNDFDVNDVYEIYPQVWTADKFDFWINSSLNLSNLPAADPMKWKAHFRKMVDDGVAQNGLVSPFDHLVSAIFETKTETNKSFNETITYVEQDAFIKVKFNNEHLRFYWNSNSQVLDFLGSTNKSVLGTSISEIGTKLAFYHEPVGNTFVIRTTSTSLAGGEVTVSFDTEGESSSTIVKTDNLFSGLDTGSSISSGQQNTGVGISVLGAIDTANNNTAVGWEALKINTAPNNTAIGTEALAANVAGQDNVAMGRQAMSLANGMDKCVCIGYQAGKSVTGDDNTLIGYAAGLLMTSAIGNIVIGANSLKANISGFTNTVVGNLAGQNCVDDENTLIGYRAGDTFTTGIRNVCIGRNTDVAASGGGSNRIVIGDGIDGTADDQFSFGKAANIVSNDFGTDALWSRASDVNKKENIEDSEFGLNLVCKLRPVEFNWKEEWGNPDVRITGLVAQDVEQALEGKEFIGHVIKEDGYQELKLEAFIPVLINAVKELKLEVDELKEKLNNG